MTSFKLTIGTDGPDTAYTVHTEWILEDDKYTVHANKHGYKHISEPLTIPGAKSMQPEVVKAYLENMRCYVTKPSLFKISLKFMHDFLADIVVDLYMHDTAYSSDINCESEFDLGGYSSDKKESSPDQDKSDEIAKLKADIEQLKDENRPNCVTLSYYGSRYCLVSFYEDLYEHIYGKLVDFLQEESTINELLTDGSADNKNAIKKSNNLQDILDTYNICTPGQVLNCAYLLSKALANTNIRVTGLECYNYDYEFGETRVTSKKTSFVTVTYIESKVMVLKKFLCVNDDIVPDESWFIIGRTKNGKLMYVEYDTE